MRKHPSPRKVRQAYRKHMLAQICTLPEDRFGAAFGMETVHVDQEPPRWAPKGYVAEDYYHYRDNGSRVLAVAHLDTVVQPKHRAPKFYDSPGKGPVVVSGALDDRLGAYVILGLLPKLGITTDVLLTVGEESAQSTAAHFTPAKDYDWIIEFDRMGTDVVMYQFEDEPSRRLVEAAGARMDWGSYSDIAYLEHLGVKAFNWGVGYGGNYHSPSGYAYLNDTFAMVAKYARFHKQNAGTVMPHDPELAYTDDFGTKADRYGGKAWVKNADGVWVATDQDECTSCYALDSLYGAGYCGECGACQECGDDEAHCDCYTVPSLRDWRADAEGESADDAIAGARAAWEATMTRVVASDLAVMAADHDAIKAAPSGLGWAGAEPAITHGRRGALTDSERRAARMMDAVATFKAMPAEDERVCYHPCVPACNRCVSESVTS